ncbi:uncharacterized protein V6R79_018283 [Siganus canaliculatus]
MIWSSFVLNLPQGLKKDDETKGRRSGERQRYERGAGRKKKSGAGVFARCIFGISLASDKRFLLFNKCRILQGHVEITSAVLRNHVLLFLRCRLLLTLLT